MATILTGNGEAAPKPWPGLFSKALPYFSRRTLRLGSGLILFAYITMHLANHALGLISLDAAEAGLKVALVVWHSWPGTGLLYGAFVFHFFNALWAVYEMRTFRVPPAELLRIVLGFWLPIALIGHIAATRIAFAVFDQSSTYSLAVGFGLPRVADGSTGARMDPRLPGDSLRLQSPAFLHSVQIHPVCSRFAVASLVGSRVSHDGARTRRIGD
jgi:hypothetical protein